MYHKSGALNDPAIAEATAKLRTRQHSRSKTMPQMSVLSTPGDKQAMVRANDPNNLNDA